MWKWTSEMRRVTIYIKALRFDLWIKRVLPLSIGNASTKFQQNTLNDLISIMCTRLFPHLSTDLSTSKIILHDSAKFDENANNN